jgi:hypothetical protein
MRTRRLALLVACTALLIGLPWPAGAQTLPDPREMSGIPLPSRDLPAGTIAVRVIRGSFTDNVNGAEVEFSAAGRTTTATTDSSGRAQTAGWPQGARVTLRTTVGGERIESQEIVVGDSGVRVMLVASPAGATAPLPRTPAGPTPGTVAIGPRSRLVVDFVDDRLRVFYVMHVVNEAASPVDLGGPVVFDLPRTARGVTLLEGTTRQATANGPRVTVTGPFAPGTTTVSFGFELPHNGPTARLDQTWPVQVQGLELIALKTGALDLHSPQMTSKQLTHQQGQPLVMGDVPAMAQGPSLALDISGLPFHPRWPRYTALAAAGVIVSWGLWAAFVPTRRRAA